MAVSFVGFSTDSGLGGTLTLTVPPGTAENDILIIYALTQENPADLWEVVTWAGLAGWRVVLNGGWLGAWSLYLARVATAAEPADYTFTHDRPLRATAGVLLAYSGCDPTLPLILRDNGDAGDYEPANHALPALGMGGSVVAGDQMVFGFLGHDGGSPWTPPAGMAERTDFASTPSIGVFDEAAVLPFNWARSAISLADPYFTAKHLSVVPALAGSTDYPVALSLSRTAGTAVSSAASPGGAVSLSRTAGVAVSAVASPGGVGGGGGGGASGSVALSLGRAVTVAVSATVTPGGSGSGDGSYDGEDEFFEDAAHGAAVVNGVWVMPKHPDAVLDFAVRWGPWLARTPFGTRDTLATSTWTVADGITTVSTSFSTDRAVIWLSGGTDGQNYTLTNTITTNGGRQDSRSFVVAVRDRDLPDLWTPGWWKPDGL